MDSAVDEARRSAEVTHDHPEGVRGAEAVAAAVYLAKTGESKAAIRAYVGGMFGYDLDRTVKDIRPTYEFEVSCQKSVPEAIVAFLNSTDFEDALRLAISLGGDSDTICCMTGSIAHAYYGEIPKWMVDHCRGLLTEGQLEVLDEFWSRHAKGTLNAARSEGTSECGGILKSKEGDAKDAGDEPHSPDERSDQEEAAPGSEQDEDGIAVPTSSSSEHDSLSEHRSSTTEGIHIETEDESSLSESVDNEGKNSNENERSISSVSEGCSRSECSSVSEGGGQVALGGKLSEVDREEATIGLESMAETRCWGDSSDNVAKVGRIETVGDYRGTAGMDDRTGGTHVDADGQRNKKSRDSSLEAGAKKKKKKRKNPDPEST